MTSFGLCHQRRGISVACPQNRREGEECAGEAVAGADSGGRDADLHADGRAGAACRQQVPTPIRRDYPLRATEKVVYTAYTR
ncbi:hypothetical protein [Nitrococcus mobilis]|uniref:hypothetical protein n=1 Tax=Nitrococcus mobilis TaxID=35797 RepID=UPI0002F32FC7|nr:hypothetical protein [Nitrococcus mobilis]